MMKKWSRGAKIAVGGIFLFVLANTGFGPIVETAQNVMDVFDFGKDIKEQVTSRNNVTDSKGNGEVKSGEDNYKSVKYNVDLEASDVKDILDFFNTQFEASGIDTNKMKVYIIDYDAFLNSKKFNKEIIDKLSKKSGTVTFMAVNPNYLTEDEMRVEFERVDKFITDNKDGVPSGVFSSIKKHGGLHVPNEGSFVMSLTFVKK